MKETVNKPPNDIRFEIVLQRDKSARDSFVYAVQTTGIYCRPGCPSPAPRAENVRFFDTTDEARSAGFRACLRCKPDQGHSGTTAAALDELEESIQRGEHPTLADLSQDLALDATRMQKSFVRDMGLSPREYVEKRRFQKFKDSMREGASVLDAALESGFESLRRPYERSRLHLAMSPGQYARGGKGLALKYQIFESFLGLTLLCTSESGIAALYLGDAREALENELCNEFHAASLDYYEDSAQRNTVLDYLQGKRPERMITLHLLGTAFQQKVWSALASIPYGQSRTYSAVAQSISQPHSVRAVARACATNRIALLIPCHRVVGSDGTLRGYRWGTERKAAILAAESDI